MTSKQMLNHPDYIELRKVWIPKKAIVTVEKWYDQSDAASFNDGFILVAYIPPEVIEMRVLRFIYSTINAGFTVEENIITFD